MKLEINKPKQRGPDFHPGLFGCNLTSGYKDRYTAILRTSVFSPISMEDQ